MTSTRTELQKIAQRLHRRAELDAADRDRQKALIVRMIEDEGATWDEVEQAADVSRPTINRTMRAHRAELARHELAPL